MRILVALFCVTCALHAKEQEHSYDGQEGSDGVDDDELQRVVVGDEEDVEDRGGGQVTSQKAAGD